MTTQDTIHPATDARHARQPATETRSAANAIETATPELKLKLQQAMESGQARVDEWTGGFQDGIRAKPIQSVLIAVAVGAVLGLIVGRRN